ncbi:MAG: ATP-binding cassette domain-containing protein [Treponema sp.]|jgi:ABC-2 type transport system ATP-binding protein|nr:ATP-binding cassette domain-containing protein [Treponema sp.]
MSFIEVSHVSKNFNILKSRSGFFGSLLSLFHREYTTKKAVDDISFSIEKGEICGYIGPNGAGKSTTLKMLSGVLTPDAGEIRVGGVAPYRERKKNAKRIGVVFGQRSQLYWDLPALDTFGLYQKLYDIPPAVYERNKSRYIELLGMGDFIGQPVRQLSLGQKMKANLALAMLHDPDVLYLDEPTIGLDVMSKKILRQSVLALNKEKNTTVMLTTHDMDDIEAVCGRLILIDKGKKLFDGALSDFKSRYEDSFMIKLEFASARAEAPRWMEDADFSLCASENNVWIIKAAKRVRPKDALTTLINRYNAENISIHEQSVEDIIQTIFSE